MNDCVRSKLHDAVAVVTIDRPHVMNAIDMDVLDGLEAALEGLEANPSVRVIIITGAGEKAFVAGGDIRAMRSLTPADGRGFVERGHHVLNRIERSRLVSIAAVNGYALGGGTELALACDLRIAAERARFGLPEVTIGLFPGWGGTQRLARTVGRGWGKYLVYTGEQISATEALEIGLVHKVVPDDRLSQACLDVAEKISRNSPIAVEQAKLAMTYGLEEPLEHGLRLEIEAWLVNLGTADRVEGLTAFLQKREPRWQGM